jgi:putative endonuclease
VYEHKNKFFKGFTARYDVDKLGYYENLETIEGAIFREKELKHWKRNWKVALIEKDNSEWRDLYNDFFRAPKQ